MSTKNIFLNALLALALIVGPITAQGFAAPLTREDRPATPEAVDSLPGYAGEVHLAVRNNATTLLPAGYTVRYVLDTSALVAAGSLQADCDDLRISYDSGGETEIDRLVEGCNTTATAVTFRTQAAVATGGVDTGYHLSYNNPIAVSPPQAPGNVFAFYDDFQDGNADGWNATKGTWSVVNDGGNYLYRYTSGGANWAISYPTLAGVADLEVLGKIRAAANTSWIGFAFRIQDANNFLTFYQSRDSNQFKYARVIGDNHTVLINPAFTMPAGTWYSMRVQAVGSLVRARIWPVGSAEPTTWTIQTTETNFQTQSGFGATLYFHNLGTNADWDDFQVRKLVDVEPAVEVYVPVPPISEWYYRAPIDVTNTSTSATLPVRYTAMLSVDTATLIAEGRMDSTCQDLQVGSLSGSDVYEIDRVVENCNTATTRVWFALQRPIAPAAHDNGYYLYYGDPTPAPPLDNEMNVFIYYEDWENGDTHWNGAGGLDPAISGTMGQSVISAEAAVSPTHAQKFPVKAAGGDAFSGFIPVSPNTTYVIGVWAKSGTNTYAPVGLDPYTTAYVKGTETWLWTNEWTINPAWTWRSASFTTAATTAYIKIKSEWWAEAPGIEPVYMDNLGLRYAIANEPALTLGDEQTTLAVPVITNVADDGPLNLGSLVNTSAQVEAPVGYTIDGVTLRIVAPVTADIPMSLDTGTNTNGVWRGNYMPAQGGTFSYRIRAHATNNTQATSALHTFLVSDSSAPQIANLTFTDPILVNETQSVSVTVTDNGVISSVTLTAGGVVHPMTLSGGIYSYSWQVTTIGENPFTITATDSSGNASQLGDSFTSQPREVEVCTWKGCKPAAASWSDDDSNNNCRVDLENAGFRGTYYVNGSTPQTWYSDYSAAGHEIGAHTVSHPCNAGCCSPNCTPENIWQCPYTQTDVDSYRSTQFDPNIASIEAATGVPVLSGAWPCGCTDAGRMTAAMPYFLGVRGYHDCGCSWVQDNNAQTPIMFMNLNGLHHYEQSYVDRAIAEGTWTIVVSHGVCDGISYIGSRRDVLWTPTVGEGLKYIKVRNAAQFSNYNREGRTISFDAVHNLAPFNREQLDGTDLLSIVYDNAVSLKVHILDTDSVESVTVDGVTKTYQIMTIDGARYVVFDTPLNGARHVVVNLAAPLPAIGAITDTEDHTVELGAAAQIDAVVTISDGTLESVTLQVLTPAPASYPMSLVGGAPNTYRASFTPGSLANVTYRIVATNNSGGSTQSTVHTLAVVDTTNPAWRNQGSSDTIIPVGSPVTLSAEGLDIGGLVLATLETDESGAWQAFGWSSGDWWHHAWQRRVPVTVTDPSGLARTAETVDVTVTAAQFPGLASCASELRVADGDKNEIPSQVYAESGSGETLACRLLFQADVSAGASRTYYIYYSNPAATPPAYSTDLSSAVAGTLLTVASSHLNLDLETSSGIVSRVRLPAGSNTNLPLSTQANSYWGWHQVCSSLDGNITGKNSGCQGGAAQATGLTLETVLDGPVVKEYKFTSVKTNATYEIRYRFFANSPYYQYSLSRSVTGGTPSVMNNFWYLNGNYAPLGDGQGGTPSMTYNTYDSGLDHVRIASLPVIEHAKIDGGDNDGTQLGGSDYRYPLAAGLSLWVVTGSGQSAAEASLAALASPLTVTAGAVENAPETRYGSPVELNGATGWSPAAFTWQNPDIPAGTTVQWRIRFCDQSDNCVSTAVNSFSIESPTAVTMAQWSATPGNRQVVVEWTTVQEIDLIGFNIYRSDLETGTRLRLNASLILAGGDLNGGSYRFTDNQAGDGKTYYYWIEAVEVGGSGGVFGPAACTTLLSLYLPLVP